MSLYKVCDTAKGLQLERARLHKLGGKKVKLFHLMYSPDHIPPSGALRILKNPHILQTAFQRRYASYPKDSLWTRCVSSREVSSKAIIRRWASNRAKVAVRQALRDIGFDPAGRYVAQDKPLSERDTTRNLKGTLEVRLTSGILTADFEEIRKQAALGLAELLEASQLQKQRK